MGLSGRDIVTSSPKTIHPVSHQMKLESRKQHVNKFKTIEKKKLINGHAAILTAEGAHTISMKTDIPATF